MNYSAVFALGVGVFVIIFFARIYLSRFKLIGEPNPARHVGDEKLLWQIFYFYSPRCSACKTITPVIEEHSKQYKQVSAVDISTDLELAQQFNVRATPTAVFIENDIVRDVQLGSGVSQTMKDFIEKHGSTN
ncbi:MAG: thioredoxin family protein [Cycloclasticus sp.]